MGIIGWIILGAVAGWIASAVNTSRNDLVMNIIIGIVGAFIGGLFFSLIGGAPVTGLNLWSLLVAGVGAVMLISNAQVLYHRNRARRWCTSDLQTNRYRRFRRNRYIRFRKGDDRWA